MIQVSAGGSARTPTGFAAGDTNEYRYVGNSPANATDPRGDEDAEPPIWKEAEKQRRWYENEEYARNEKEHPGTVLLDGLRFEQRKFVR